MNRLIIFILLLTSFSVLAQSPAGEQKWGVVLTHPDMASVRVNANISYHNNGNTLDIYLPPLPAENNTRPAVIFLPETGMNKDMEIYKTWPRLMACYGIVGITANVDPAKYNESVKDIFNFIVNDGAKHGIDAGNVGVFMASHVPDDVANTLVKENSFSGLKCVVLYYRNPTLRGPFRTDLPVLWVADDQQYFPDDRTTPVWNEVQKSKAPWTMTFGRGMPYFFDAYEDTDEARKIIRQTIYFFRNYLEPLPMSSSKPAPDRQMIAALYRGDLDKAATLFKSWIDKNPDDQYALTKYAMISMIQKNYPEAEKAYSKVVKLAAVEMIDYARVLFALNKTRQAKDLVEKAVATGEMRRSPYAGVGSLLYSLGNYKDGVLYFEKAVQADNDCSNLISLAGGYARISETDKAFATLEQASGKSCATRQQIDEHPDLQSLRADSRFRKLLEKFR
jgi:hypothetical protein